MTEEEYSREEILKKLVTVLEVQESISELIGKRLCDHCESPEEDWEERRALIMKHMKSLLVKYDFAKLIPRNDLGISAQAVMSDFIRVQQTYAQIILMIDLIRGASFGEIYLNSMNSIATKAHQQLIALKNLALERISNPEAATMALQSILRLEREIDEDNIVICRQISVASAEGEANFTCYMMRKIVSELEHISDYIKDAAEIVIGI
jgi:uncharacterized protein Yka (UPF0111/DUF47 family)